MNTKLVAGNITKNINGGYNAVIDSSVTAENFKLPMIVNVDITLKFVESRDTTSSEIYGYLPPVRTAPTTP
jgi:hypothetical protein